MHFSFRPESDKKLHSSLAYGATFLLNIQEITCGVERITETVMADVIPVLNSGQAALS